MTLLTSQLRLSPLAPHAVSSASGIAATVAPRANGGAVAQAASGNAREAG